ncbi:MAG: VOC family protein, partial [Xanthobacteraceae bacterium]
THNHIVQLPGFFIEILTLAEPGKLGGDGLSLQFGAFNRDAIARGDGFSMLMLESSDIEEDALDFARSGISCSPVLPFSRAATLADGSSTTVGFSLVFARAAASPHAGFALCQQRNPLAFWNPAFQAHDNGASGVAGVALVADEPAAYRPFLSAFTGVQQLVTTPAGIAARTPRGVVEIMDAAAFRDRFGVTPRTTASGLGLAGLRVTVRDLDRLQGFLKGNAIDALHRAGALVVPPISAFGATLIFEG